MAPAADRPGEGFVSVSVEHWASASLEFEGRGGADANADAAAALARVVGAPGCLDRRSLCVAPGSHVWRLHVDALVLTAGGCLLDALSLCAYAALADTWCGLARAGARRGGKHACLTRRRLGHRVPHSLPKLVVVRAPGGDGGGDGGAGRGAGSGVEVDVDPDPSAVVRLDVSRVPLAITLALVRARAGERGASAVGRYAVGQVEGIPVVDARAEEECCAAARLVVAVNAAREVCAIDKAGDGAFPLAALAASIQAGGRGGRGAGGRARTRASKRGAPPLLPRV